MSSQQLPPETKDEAKETQNSLPPDHPDGGKLFYKDEIGLSGWSEHVDEESKRKYWFSSVTQESVWTEPPEVTAARVVVGHGDEVKTNNILPRTVDAHVGKIFGDDRRPGMAVPPPVIEEEAYVPVSFAKARLETMEAGMKVAQKRFSDQTGKLAEYYSIVEEATQAHYLAFINGLKNKAIRRIGHYKAVLEKVNREHAAYRKTAEETINSTEAKNSQLEVEKAALLKRMKEEKEAMKKSQKEELNSIHNAEGVDAQNRKKQASVLAAALRAERDDLSRVHDQVLEDVKTMQKEHDESLNQVTSVVEKLASKMKEELQTAVATATSTATTATAAAAAVAAAKGDEGDNGKQTLTETKSAAVPSAITAATANVDTEVVERLNTQLEDANRQADALRKELAANQKAAEDMSNQAASSESDDIETVRSQLSASQQAKAMMTNKNRSLQVELEATKKKVEAVKAAAKVAVDAAASSAERAAQISTVSSSRVPAADSSESARLKQELVAVRKELQLARTSGAGGGAVGSGMSVSSESGGGNAASPLTSSTGNNSEEAVALRNQLDVSRAELEAAHEELFVLRAAMDAADADENDEDDAHMEEQQSSGMSEAERTRIEAEHLAKLQAIEEQKAALEAQLVAAAEAANAAAAAANAVLSAPADTSMHPRIRKCIGDGRALWGNNDKAGCAKLYLDAAIDIAKVLGDAAPGVNLLKAGIKKAKGKPAPRAAVTVRKAFDAYLKSVPEGNGDAAATPTSGRSGPSPEEALKMKELQNQLASLKREKEAALKQQKALSSVVAVAAGASSAKPRSPRSASANEKALQARLKSTEVRLKSSQTKVKTLEHDLADARKQASDAGPSQSHSSNAGHGDGGTGAAGGNPKKEKEMQKKIKELEKKLKDTGVKQRQMQNKLEKAEQKLSQSSGDDPSAKKALERRVKEMEKKATKAMVDATKLWEGKLSATEKKLTKNTKRADDAEASAVELQKQVDDLKTKLKEMGAMGKQMEELKAKADEADDAKKRAAEAEKVAELMTKQYKEESVLRKRYFNMMEDMKGKIRVFCRTRPMSSSEKERKCEICVDYPDEVSIGVTGEKGRKEFLFDQCFTPQTSQEEVFEDASHLIQSAFDGFNVCIFAYGQSGSGKTFTMVGPPSLPGLTPRAIGNIFDNKAALKGKAEVNITVYMAELYNDGLIDLLWKHDQKEQGKHDHEPPRLDIKKDSKGMVFIKGIITKQVNTVEETMKVFNAGNNARHISSTGLNSESSRSHLVFAVLIENKDLMTHKTSLGKLSLVDLAGSESVGKTGATKDRLKEAQSINKR